MLTLSFIHNFAPKNLSQKQWTEKQKHSQENYPVHLLPGPIFKQRSTPHRKPCVQKFGTKKLYTGEIMSVSAVPNTEINKDLVVDNPKLIYGQNSLNFHPSIVPLQA